MPKNVKKLTILHSNDFHGDFLAEQVDEKLVGGVSRLCGYVNQVRDQEQNVIYAIAGDMFRGSLIDSEYQGISTIDIMNRLAPDVVCVGNHEVDYGLAHLLFLERCARFPIICANMYIKYVDKRLFNPHWICEIDGMRVLFIGILTQEVLKQTKNEELIGLLLDVEDAATEIGRVCDAYRTTDIDLTVLLTHIGFDEDKELAAALDPSWGVDIIIGGHSHTTMSEPCVVAGIPIVQAAVGTDQIGRFDIVVDTDNNRMDSYTWKCIPITSKTCPRDTSLETVIASYKKETDQKYGQVLVRFPRAYTHPRLNMETELGDVLAEGLHAQLDIDLMLVGSTSISKPQLGPTVTLIDFMEAFPYCNRIYQFSLTGEQLRRAMSFMLREDAFVDPEHCMWFQVSKGFYCEYDRPTQRILVLRMHGKEVQDNDVFTVAMQGYHFENIGKFLNIQPEEVNQNGTPREVASNETNVLQEYFGNHSHLEIDSEPRLVVREA